MPSIRLFVRWFVRSFVRSFVGSFDHQVYRQAELVVRKWVEKRGLSAEERYPFHAEHQKLLGNLGWCQYRNKEYGRAVDLYEAAIKMFGNKARGNLPEDPQLRSK